MKETKHYGLLTAISMIVGICIGSGIFFKADDILVYTGGNVLLSVLVFIIGALCVIFGSMTLTELAGRTTKRGGIVGYFEEFVSPKVASAIGWFHIGIYFPTIAVVVSWVAGIYTIQLLGLHSSLHLEILIGLIYLTFFFGMNYLSFKSGGRFQNITTVVKLIPLIGIGLLGIFWTQAAPDLPAGVEAIAPHNVGWGWLAALTPTAFAFDGWIVATTITPEVKRAKRNMPIALIAGPLIVLAVYVAYFLGMVSIVGEEYILSAGDGAVSQMGYSIFGSAGEQILLAFVLISILGVLNGVTLGYIRLPQALAMKGMLPQSERISQISESSQLSPLSASVAFGMSFLWMILHYVTQATGVLGNGDVNEIAVVFSYATYILLYVQVMKLKKDGVITNPIMGYVVPVFAILGSLVILVGGIFSNPMYMPFFLLISFMICIVGYQFYNRKEARLASLES
jgi:APA family basic amino acid/polyamine antiporter